MRRFGLAILSVLILCLWFGAQPASAHELKTDGTVSGVLHIEPNDDPVAGQPSQYLLFFSDTSARFSLPNCMCGVTITHGGRQLYAQALGPGTGPLEAQGAFTFPQAGTYTVQVNGRAQQAGGFQSFSLNYTVEASADPNARNTAEAAWILALGAGLIAVGVGLVIRWK